MVSIIRPGLWTARQQPQVAVEIDWTHSLTRGLVFCMLARPGGGMVDLTGRARVVSGLTQPVRQGGLTLRTWSITGASTADLDFTSGGWAAGAFFNLSSVSTTQNDNAVPIIRASYTSESLNSGWDLAHLGLSSKYGTDCFANNAIGFYRLISNATATVGDHFLGTTSDGSSVRRLIIDGVQDNTSIFSFNPATWNGAANDASGATGIVGGSYLILAWNRDVTLPEWAWLNAEPYCFLRPRAVAIGRTPAAAAPFVVFPRQQIQIWDH